MNIRPVVNQPVQPVQPVTGNSQNPTQTKKQIKKEIHASFLCGLPGVFSFSGSYSHQSAKQTEAVSQLQDAFFKANALSLSPRGDLVPHLAPPPYDLAEQLTQPIAKGLNLSPRRSNVSQASKSNVSQASSSME